MPVSDESQSRKLIAARALPQKSRARPVEFPFLFTPRFTELTWDKKQKRRAAAHLSSSSRLRYLLTAVLFFFFFLFYTLFFCPFLLSPPSKNWQSLFHA